MRFLPLFFLLGLNTAFADELQSVTQHIDIKKQGETAWQQDLLYRHDLDRKWQIGVQGTYLERFDKYEKRAGAIIVYRPSELWTFEARYLQGMGSEILPERETSLTAYHSTMVGIAPFFSLKDSRYSNTTLDTFNLGVEIEKIEGFIFIPSMTVGAAKFKDPNETKAVYTFGLRASYYQESKYIVSLFGFTGKEASQAITGKSSELVTTLTGGASFEWFFSDSLRAEIIVDHTDYDQLNNQFITSTLNLRWTF